LQYFQTRFLEEADKFIAGLDPKAARKVFYNIDVAEQSNDPNFSKNFKKTFGSSGQNLVAYKLDYLHFGTKTIKLKPWFLQLTVY
jgi:hypothetical protein